MLNKIFIIIFIVLSILCIVFVIAFSVQTIRVNKLKVKLNMVGQTITQYENEIKQKQEILNNYEKTIKDLKTLNSITPDLKPGELEKKINLKEYIKIWQSLE